MIKVHHLNNSRSQRVLWLLEELGLEYEVVRYKRDPRTMLAPASLRAIHPLGKAPVIEDGSLRLAETGAIVDYVVDRYGRKLAPPAHNEAFWRYRYWLHYAEGSAMPPLLVKLVLNRLGLLGWPARRFVDGQIALHLDYLEAQLEGRSWFAGDDFSAADIMMSFPLEVAAMRAGLNATRPNLSGFLASIHARPAYQNAVKRGGEYALAR
ncbi:MAG TPA: glutathione S-transferase [Roseiarcus sp.]|nr:glutathione S-transferase [Roseiarcus sp.]